MHEIRATIPSLCVPEVAGLAHTAGIARVKVARVFVHGPDQEKCLVSVETSTPKARASVDALLGSPTLAKTDYTVTSREVRAIVDDQHLSELTLPMSEPFTDVIQDLWQSGHVTMSYVARAAAGAILLATGIIENNPISIVVAALFLPFLSQVRPSALVCGNETAAGPAGSRCSAPLLPVRGAPSSRGWKAARFCSRVSRVR